MKPYTLTLQAFGPFETPTTIDFTRFNNSLFLITGKTGAGKSTIFDALMYALFGETSGKERAAKEMRTQNIDAKIKTVITLEFEHNGRRYRIERTISGRKTNTEDATLWNTDGIIVEKTRAVTAAIEQLLGIEAEQFRMIAMLPQGKFRELLTAKSDDKSEILKKLFDTRIYALFQNKLKERDSQFQNERKDFETEIGAEIRQLIVPEDEPAYTWLSEFIASPSIADSNLEALFSDLQKLAEDDAEHIDRMDTEILALKTEHTRVTEEKGKAESINRMLEQAAAARRNLEELLPQEESYKRKEITVKRARAAESVSSAETAYLTAEKLRTDLETTITSNTKIAEETQPLLAGIVQELDAREHDSAVISAREKRESLKLSLSAYQKLNDAEAEQRRLEDAMTESMIQASSICAEIDAIQEEIQRTEDRSAALGTIEAELTGTQNSLQNIRDRQHTLEELETIAEDLTILETALLNRQQECRRAKEAYLEQQSAAENLHRLYLDGQAGILADTLEDDMPCPVCGSRNHPSPAKHSEKIPDRAAVTSAQKAAEKARDTWTNKTTAAAECRTKRTTREDEFRRIAGTFVTVSGSIDEICTLLAACAGNLKCEEEDLLLKSSTLTKQVSEKQRLAETLPKLRADRDTKQQVKANTEQRYSADSGRLKELSNSIADLRKTLPYPTRKETETALADLDRTIDQHETEIAGLRTRKDELLQRFNQASGILQDARARLETAQKEETAAHAAYLRARETNGFATIEEYRNALMNAHEIAELERTVREYFTNLSTAKAVCETAEENSRGRTHINLEVLTQRQTELDSELTRLQNIRNRYQERSDTNKRVADSIAEQWARRKSRIELHTAMHKLAETANGSINHQDKIDLERYVQAVYFTEILQFANNQLQTMSNNRYTLIRRESATSLQKKSGLDLAVIDRFTGQMRDVTTLSGGESFLAALALALGLSEMIQHMSGGISIDALFVDEGFDTLDTDALQDVLKVLWRLTTGNRVVGIISHRGELRDQLDRKIIVTKLGNGRSRLEPKY